MRVSEYYDLEMYSDSGNHIGTVKEVMLDTENGEIAGLVFEQSGGKYIAVPYQTVMGIGDIITIKSKKQETPKTTQTSEEEVGIREE